MDDITFKSASILSNTQLSIIIIFCLLLSIIFFIIKRKDLNTVTGIKKSLIDVSSQRVSRTANIHIIKTTTCEIIVFESEYGVLQLDNKTT